MPRALDPEQENVLVARYQAGESTPKLAADYGIVASTAWSILKRHGVQTRSGIGNPRSLNDAQEAELIARYAAGETAAELAAAYGIGWTTAKRMLDKHHVVMRPAHPRPLPLWHEAFDELTPDAAYWIGFLFADGHVKQRSPQWSHEIIVALAAVDRPHLVRLREYLRAGHALSEGFTTGGRTSKPGARFPMVRLAISSRRIGQRLLDLGRYGEVDPSLVRSRHFWRGLNDGDGSVGVQRNKGVERPVIQLLGSLPHLTAFNQFLEANGLPPRTISQKPGIMGLSASGAPGEEIIDLLYRDAPTALARKAERATRLIGTMGNLEQERQDRHEAQVAEATRLAQEGVSRVDIAARLGVHRSTLRHWNIPSHTAEHRDARITEAKRLAAAGYMKKEIVDILGVNKTTLQDWGLQFKRGRRVQAAESEGRLF